MASKVFTAQELRQRANEEEHLWHDHLIAAMLRQAADALERENNRNKKYEYAVKWLDENSVANNMGEHREWAESIVRDVGASKVRLVRRSVSEWEEVKDGK